MENSIDKEYQRTKKNSDIYAESGAEYVIPDYKGDIRKLLVTDAQIRPSGSFSSGGELEFSGIVVYNIVYADSDGGINCASFSSDYEYKVKCSEQNYISSASECKVSNVSIRLVGPRKICAKATLSAVVTVTERAEITVGGTAFEREESPELLTRCVNTGRSALSESAEREYAEVLISLDGAIADEINVVYSGADVDIDSAEFKDGILSLEGEITLFALIKNGDEPIFIAEKRIDVVQDIPFEDATADMAFIPSATVVSLRESVNPTESGSEVVLSAIVEFSAVGESNSETELVEDAYMRSCVCENIYDDFSYSEFLQLAELSESFEGAVERASVDCDGIREVITLTAQAKLNGVDIKDDSVDVRGEIRFAGVACGVDQEGRGVYAPIKFSSEFNKNVKLSCQISDKTRIEPKITLSHIRGGIDERNVWSSADMDIKVSVFEDRSARVLASSAVRDDLPFEERGAKVSVYYPSKDETLFSVAKKFHTTQQKIAMDNSLSVSTASFGEPIAKRLVIF